MDVQLRFPDGTLSTEHEALVETLDRFLALHPVNGDEDAALRLVMELLELADVAPQPEIARAVDYSQDRSVRLFKVRLQEQGLGGLFDRPITGRPAVTSQPAVGRAVVQAILEAVIAPPAARSAACQLALLVAVSGSSRAPPCRLDSLTISR